MAFESELQIARSLGSRAGELALRYQREGFEVEDKADQSPVTTADKESEKLIAEGLLAAFPADGLFGEEGSRREGTSGRRWIVDPIDGTRDYSRGSRLFCNLIALEAGGVVEVGVCTFPAYGEQYYAVRGEGAFRVYEGRMERVCDKEVEELSNGESRPGGRLADQGVRSTFSSRTRAERIRCSEIGTLSRAVVCTVQLNKALGQRYGRRLLEFLSGAWSVRSLGGAMDAMLVASGKAEVYFEPHLQPWDLAALSVIAKEAGARYFDFEGNDTIYSGNCVICAPGMELVMKDLLRIGG